jgi:hypothetical protein
MNACEQIDQDFPGFRILLFAGVQCPERYHIVKIHPVFYALAVLKLYIA